VGRRKCDRKKAVLVLAKHGVDARIIAEALGLNLSTVEAYIKRYGKKAPANNGSKIQQKTEQPATAAVPKATLPNNQWIQLLRSRGQ